MISDKSFNQVEFHAKVKEFAQEFINRCTVAEDKPNVQSVDLKQTAPNEYVLILNKSNGAERYSFTHHQDGKIETLSVYGTL